MIIKARHPVWILALAAVIGLMVTQQSFSAAWHNQAQATPTVSRPTCVLVAPSAPQPENGGEVMPGTITLRWQVRCAVSVELRINRTPVATMPAATVSYIMTPQAGRTDWQVIARDEAGNRAESDVWRFTVDEGRWLSTPRPTPNAPRLFEPTAPGFAVEVTLDTPQEVLLATGFALCAGFSLIIAAAVVLGVRAERRRDRFPTMRR